jgi:hypothetical protein
MIEYHAVPSFFSFGCLSKRRIKISLFREELEELFSGEDSEVKNNCQCQPNGLINYKDTKSKFIFSGV